MTPRSRPEACCEARAVRPLPERERGRLVATLKALADENRLEILRFVAAQPGAVCVCDIVDAFDLSQPTISHHLKVLKDAGLVEGSRQGIWSFYELAPGALEALAADLAGLPERDGRARASAPCCGDGATQK